MSANTNDPAGHHMGRTTSRIVGVILALVAVIGVGIGGGSTASAKGCDSLRIESVAVDRCVVPGRQAEIDAGNVARVGDLSTSNGHWLAGHRSTHGSTFGPLTDMEIGDVVDYRGQRYRIVEYTTARFASPGRVLGWTSMDVATVVLQTSVDNVSAHLWRAELIAPEQTSAAAGVERVNTAVAGILAPPTPGPSRIASIVAPLTPGPSRVTAMVSGAR